MATQLSTMDNTMYMILVQIHKKLLMAITIFVSGDKFIHLLEALKSRYQAPYCKQNMIIYR